MNTTPESSRRPSWAGIAFLAIALGLLAFYFFRSQANVEKAPDTAAASVGVDPNTGAPAGSANPLPPGAVSDVGGIPLDANGNRILNSAGLPISNEPLPEAKPIPVKAPAGTVVGYTKDAQGNSKPLVAGDLKQVPNTPGSYAVVDMWADGGPTVVAPTQGKHLTEAELKRLQEAERAREQASSKQP